MSEEIKKPDENESDSLSSNFDRRVSLENNEVKLDKIKYDILLKPTGDVPIMKKKKWSVEADKPIGWIIDFMKKYLKLDPQDRLFLYVNQNFAPSRDQIVRNLYECFGADGKLVLHYCKTPAWG
ncbi:autophagy protein 12-like [Onthophagus taurus]|uniref:autophagy protein 12-like n=1 Tax=Onthophagus taurus TaxID=166361 RepID=UPI000C207F3B|nr:autophagy protein 12-like [Onthophagus taurus]